jgi:hypothetical protein
MTIIDVLAGSVTADDDHAARTASFAAARAGVARADELVVLGDRVRDFVAASKAPETLRAYHRLDGVHRLV